MKAVVRFHFPVSTTVLVKLRTLKNFIFVAAAAMTVVSLLIAFHFPSISRGIKCKRNGGNIVVENSSRRVKFTEKVLAAVRRERVPSGRRKIYFETQFSRQSSRQRCVTRENQERARERACGNAEEREGTRERDLETWQRSASAL